jgi:anti-anti-sigma factor
VPAEMQRVVVDGDVATVYLSGEVDLANEVEVLEVMRAAIDKGPATVNVDLGGVEFMGSRGVAVLAIGAREAHEHGIAFEVGPATPIVERIFDVTHIREAFDDEEPVSG